ncbi:aldehyde dehydrogenase family protein, partial [Xanthomonas oryzae pv. oryzae]
MSADLLKTLDLAASNSGTYLGEATWSQASGAGVLQPLNPTTNAVIADVQATTPDDYELIIQRAQAAFKVWRTTPAPRRGEA